jgi:hypothetical protein
MARCIVLLLISLLSVSTGVSARSETRKLRDVLKTIEQRSGFRFLYRESLVSRIQVDWTPTENLADLERLLDARGLHLAVDEARKVAIITEKQEKAGADITEIMIHVVDASSGSPLPFATISWKMEQHFQGLTTDENGRANIPFHNNQSEIRISYVGYKTVFVQAEALKDSHNPVISLFPDVVESNAVVVSEARFLLSPDTATNHWIGRAVAGFAGDRNVLRSLQAVPAVAPVIGLNKGLVVRGSNPDAFQVLLDGMTIYHQSHLFGLLDAFQSDALQAVAFHYAMIPAQFPSPPGGTLAFYTRSGPSSSVSAQAGLSNSSFRGMLSVPLAGRGSIMVAGRKSLLGSINWLGNRELISFGLDVNRPHSAVETGAVPAEQRLLQNRTADADFTDLHAKAGFELSAKTRIAAAAYLGRDEAAESADRYFQVSNSPLFNQRFKLFPVATRSNWDNTSWSATITHVPASSMLVTVQTGGSRYNSSFTKGDFAYPPRLNQQQPGGPLPPLSTTVVDTFSNSNSVSEFKLNPNIDVALSSKTSLTAGAAYFYYDVAYREINAQRNGAVRLATSSAQIDAYAQVDHRFHNGSLQAGIRAHHFAVSSATRLSPRILVEYALPAAGTFKAGYNRNYQFLHRFGINQQIPADVWSLSGKVEPVTEADHLFAGWKRGLWRGASLSADVYTKKTRNMRLHEITSVMLTQNTLDNPRFYGNDAYSRGLELLLDQQLGRHRLAISYTLAHTEIQNDLVNRGNRYDAEWDRRHQGSIRYETIVFNHLRLFATQTISSGIPNYLKLFSDQLPQAQRFSGEPERLGWYYRTDAGASVSARTGSAHIEASLSFFNIFNRQNPWYRTVIQVIETDRFGRQNPQNYPVDVYDLGFRPSFELVIRF